MSTPLYGSANTTIPIEIVDAAQRASNIHGVPRDNILAMILVENPQFKTKLVHTNTNGSTDHGISQINSCNHKEFFSLGFTDINNVEENIEYGTLKLKYAYDKYKDWNMAYMVYNMGDGGANRLFKQGIYSSKYSRKVMERYSNINQYLDNTMIENTEEELDIFADEEFYSIDSILFENVKFQETMNDLFTNRFQYFT